MGKIGKRTGLAVAAMALATALAVPASAPAATTVIGKVQLTGGTPSFSALCGAVQCTTVQDTVPSAQDYVVTSPVDGTVTSWSFRTPAGGTSGSTYSLRVVRPAGGGKFTAVATSNSFTRPDMLDKVHGPIATSIPVKKGDRIGIRTASNEIPTLGVPGSTYLVFAPPSGDLVDGGPALAPQQNNPGSQVAVQATITFTTPPPGCPPNCPPPAPVPPGAKPSLTRLSVSPKTFRAASRGASVALVRRPPVGTKISYQLSQAATTTFTLERKATGRRVNRRCVAPKRSNRTKPRCTRYVKVSGSFTRAGTAGANSFRFTGRLRGRKLAPGGYRLTGVAANTNGKSSAVTTTFNIVK